MSIFHTKNHYNFMKLPEMNVYYIYFQTEENKFGVSNLLFEMNAHECELHSILMYKWDFYCCLKHTKFNFVPNLSISKMMLLD